MSAAADQVYPGIWVGGKHSDDSGSFLSSKRIKGILVLRSSSDSHAKLGKDVEFKRISIKDNPRENIGRHFDRTNDFIRRNLQRGAVLVRCHAGRSRSVTIAIAFLMRYKGWTVDQALREIRSRRPGANPNRGFMRQLYAYERWLRSAYQQGGGSGVRSERQRPPRREEE